MTQAAVPALIAWLLNDEPDPSPEVRLPPQGMLVGRVLDTKHPSLFGRVYVEWSTEAGTVKVWLPVLRHMSVRTEDRVLIAQPANWNEPIVAGVLDGFAARPEPRREEAAAVELRDDEVVRVVGSNGVPLVEMFRGERGPVVRLLADAEIDLEGGLRLSARSIAFIARTGEIALEARDDVIVKGEMIQLNP